MARPHIMCTHKLGRAKRVLAARPMASLRLLGSLQWGTGRAAVWLTEAAPGRCPLEGVPLGDAAFPFLCLVFVCCAGCCSYIASVTLVDAFFVGLFHMQLVPPGFLSLCHPHKWGPMQISAVHRE